MLELKNICFEVEDEKKGILKDCLLYTSQHQCGTMIAVSACEGQLVVFLVINFQNTAVFHKCRGGAFGGDLYGFSRFRVNGHTPLPHGLGVSGKGFGFHQLVFSGIEIAKVDFSICAADPGTDNGLPAGFNLVIL